MQTESLGGSFLNPRKSQVGGVSFLLTTTGVVANACAKLMIESANEYVVATIGRPFRAVHQVNLVTISLCRRRRPPRRAAAASRRRPSGRGRRRRRPGSRASPRSTWRRRRGRSHGGGKCFSPRLSSGPTFLRSCSPAETNT